MAACMSNGNLKLGLFQNSQLRVSLALLVIVLSYGHSWLKCLNHCSHLHLIYSSCCQKSPVIWLSFVSINTTLFLRYWYIYTIPLTAPTASILARKTLWKWSLCHCSFSGLSPWKAKVVEWFPLPVPSTHAPTSPYSHTPGHINLLASSGRFSPNGFASLSHPPPFNLMLTFISPSSFSNYSTKSLSLTSRLH